MNIAVFKILLFIPFCLLFNGCGIGGAEKTDEAGSPQATVHGASLRAVRPVLGHLGFHSETPRLKPLSGGCTSEAAYDSVFFWNADSSTYALQATISLSRTEVFGYLRSFSEGPEVPVSNMALGSLVSDLVHTLAVGKPLCRFSADSILLPDTNWRSWPTHSVEINQSNEMRNDSSRMIYAPVENLPVFVQNLNRANRAEKTIMYECFQEDQGKFFLALPVTICSE